MPKRDAAPILAVVSALVAGAATAHPHQFIDAEARLILGAGGIEAVHATFAMDEIESLYIASEFGLDPDGPLTPEQAKTVFDAYAAGYEEFNWFTHVTSDGAPAPLSPPRSGAATMKDGVLTIAWELPLKTPLALDAAPILLQFFDPTYFAAVVVTAAPRVVGPGAEACDVLFTPFEPDAALARQQQLLALLPREATPDDPRVGRLFADRVEARCDGAGWS